MASRLISGAVEQVGIIGFVRIVGTSFWRVPTAPEPPTKWADDVWAAEFPADLTGRVYAITGASNGMGKHLAEKLAVRGASVLMVNRPSAHSTKAFEEVKKSAKNPDAVHLVDCDLCSFASVRKAAESLKSISPELDGLVCNAGLMAQADKRTEDGYDVQIQANHLSHFLLTSLLFDMLAVTGRKRGQPSRIVQHSSGARMGDPIASDCFEKEWKTEVDEKGNEANPRKGDGSSMAKWRRYQQSKRLNLGYTYALADYIKKKGLESDVIATCAHPGATNSGLQSRTAAAGFMDNLINGIAACAGHSTADGCLGLALATLQPGAQSGAFYGPKGMVGKAELMPSELEQYDKDQLDLIWNGSISATGSKL